MVPTGLERNMEKGVKMDYLVGMLTCPISKDLVGVTAEQVF